MCVVAAARAGEGVQSCVSGGGSRRVTPGGGGASRAGWQQRESGQAAAHAAQSPGVARRGRGETYTGPPGPAQRRRRGLRTAPPPPRALALRPASLQVTLGAAGKLQEDRWETAGGRLRVDGGLRACGPESLGTLFLRLLCALSRQSLEISEES